MMAETAVADAVSMTRSVVAILQTEARPGAVAVVAAVAVALQTTTVIALVVTTT